MNTSIEKQTPMAQEVFNHFSAQAEKFKQSFLDWQSTAERKSQLDSIQAATDFHHAESSKLEATIQYFTDMKYWLNGFGNVLGKAALLRAWECGNTTNPVLEHMAKLSPYSLLHFAFLHFDEKKGQYVIAEFFSLTSDELLSDKICIWSETESGIWVREIKHANIEDVFQECVAYMDIHTWETHLIDERVSDLHCQSTEEMASRFVNVFGAWKSEFHIQAAIATDDLLRKLLLMKPQGSLNAKDVLEMFEHFRTSGFVFNSPSLLQSTVFRCLMKTWAHSECPQIKTADFLLAARFNVLSLEQEVADILDSLRNVRHFANTAKIMFDFYGKIDPTTTVFTITGAGNNPKAAQYRFSHFIWRNGWIAAFQDCAAQSSSPTVEIRAEKIQRNVHAYNPI